MNNLPPSKFESIDDAELYNYLVRTFPEGKVMVSANERANFEAWLALAKDSR